MAEGTEIYGAIARYKKKKKKAQKQCDKILVIVDPGKVHCMY